jgi:hypothetical protein
VISFFALEKNRTELDQERSWLHESLFVDFLNGSLKMNKDCILQIYELMPRIASS